ncbi:MAG: hypothetical protein WDM90_25150 [Ferruginibacter sp.]
MNDTLRLILNFSIIIPVIISWIRFKKINPVYYPFIFYLWLGLINETLSRILGKYFHSNAINSNIYILLESFLIAWQFYAWGLFKHLKKLYVAMLSTFLIAWLLENFVFFDFNHFSSYFRIGYFFIVVLMSIAFINILLVRERKSLLTNPTFLICVSFAIYYTYSILVEIFWAYGLNTGQDFQKNIYRVLLFFNAFAYIVYSFAIIWMRTKQRFTLPS